MMWSITVFLDSQSVACLNWQLRQNASLFKVTNSDLIRKPVISTSDLNLIFPSIASSSKSFFSHSFEKSAHQSIGFQSALSSCSKLNYASDAPPTVLVPLYHSSRAVVPLFLCGAKWSYRVKSRELLFS